MNAVIHSVVRSAATHYGSEVIEFRDGRRGLLEDRTTPLDIAAVDGLLTSGGTTLGSARVVPQRLDAGLAPMKGSPRTTAATARWWPCAAPRSCSCRSPVPWRA